MIAGIVRDGFTPPLRGLIAQSVARTGDTTMAEVEGAVVGAVAQLWAVFEAGAPILAAVTQLHVTGGVKDAFCWQMGGDFDRGGPVLVPLFLEWARNEGCAFAEINGRVGWMRKLRDWEAVSVVLRKALV